MDQFPVTPAWNHPSIHVCVAFVEDSIIAANIFDVWVAYSETRGYTKVLSDVPSNKERFLTPQQFRLVARARFVRITPSALGSGLLNVAEVRGENPSDAVERCTMWSLLDIWHAESLVFINAFPKHAIGGGGFRFVASGDPMT